MLRIIVNAQRYWRSFVLSMKMLPETRVTVTASAFPRSMRHHVHTHLRRKSAYPCNAEQIFLPRKFSNPSTRWIVFDQRREVVHVALDVRDYLEQACLDEARVDTFLRMVTSMDRVASPS